MKKVVGLASLFEPLEFLDGRIKNLSSCDLKDVLIYWVDCSDAQTQEIVRNRIKESCPFEYRFIGLNGKKTLYWVWNYIVDQTMRDPQINPQYFCTVNVDDLQAPDYFSTMATHLDNHPEIQIAVPQWYASKTKGQQWPPTDPGVFVDPDVHRTLGHFPMWRATLHDAVGNFNPQLRVVGDSDFWDRIKRRFGYAAISVVPRPLSMYLDHEKNLYKTSKLPSGITGEAWDRKLMGL